MLMVTIVTAGIMVNLGLQYNQIADASENYKKKCCNDKILHKKKFKYKKKLTIMMLYYS